MNTQNAIRRSSWALALMCCLGLPMTSSAQMADDNYYYEYDLDNASQMTRPIDQFFMGRTVHSQEQGELQMSLSGSHERSSVESGSQRFSEVKARAEIGVTDRLQFQAELPYQIDDRPGSSFNAQTNIGNVQVGAMYSVLRGDDPISLSAGMDVQVPVGRQASLMNQRDSRSSDQTLWKPSLIVAKDFGGTQVHSDVQAELGGTAQGLNYNIGAVLPVGSFAPSLEFSGRTMEGSTPQFYATPGLTYSISDRTEFGVGVPIGLNQQSTQAAVVGKFSFQLR